MKTNWWKFLGIAIMLYVLIAGLIVPLKPGIISCYPNTVKPGYDVEFNVATYNTNLKTAKDQNVFLKFDDDQILSAKSGKVISNNELNISFDIPIDIQSKTKIASATLIIDNEIDGPAILPQAIFVKEYSNEFNEDHWVGDIRDKLHVKDNFAFPFRSILYETVRNTFFHVAIWMAMFVLLILSVYNSIQYLRTRKMNYDQWSNGLTSTAIVFGLAGIATGSLWAKYTWGTYWTTDIKLNMSAITLLLYLAYWILRASIEDIDSRARLASLYNIFAFFALIPLLIILPRLTDSLHPGNGGNPALGGEDLDNTLRMVFYPAIIGLTLMGLWISELYFRYLRLENNMIEKDNS